MLIHCIVVGILLSLKQLAPNLIITIINLTIIIIIIIISAILTIIITTL